MAYRDVRSARKFLGQLLEHDPASIDTREFRVDLLNSVYQAVNDSADWLFLQNESDWSVWEERDGEDLGITVSVTAGSQQIVFSSTLGTDFTASAGGMEFEDDDGDTYVINRFTNGTTAYINRVYAGSTDTTMETWKIKSGRYYLPTDCARALAFINRDSDNNGQYLGPMTIVDRRTEEQTTSWWTDQQGMVFWLVDNTAEFDDPPQPGFTVADSTAAGTFAASSDYEVCYTFAYQGRETMPSVPVRVTTSSAGSHQLVITGMADTRNSAGGDTGVYKNIYVRRLTSSQTLPSGDLYTRWYRASADVAESTTSATLTTPPANYAAGLTFQTGRKYMKTVWQPGGDYTFRLRYLRQPQPLVADSDAPWWPAAYHDAMVYGAAVNLGLSQGASQGKIDRWQKLYDNLIAGMRDQQMIVPNMPTVKRQRTDGRNAGTVYYTRGNASTDFSG